MIEGKAEFVWSHGNSPSEKEGEGGGAMKSILLHERGVSIHFDEGPKL